MGSSLSREATHQARAMLPSIRPKGAEVTWEPIRRSGQQAKGLDPKHQGLMVIEVNLAPVPPADWIKLWNPTPPNAPRSVSHAQARVSGSTAILRVPDKDVMEAIELLDQQIAAANDWYENEVLPRFQEAERTMQDRQDEKQRRIDEVQRQLDELDGGSDDDSS
jgi:hypothetical protein